MYHAFLGALFTLNFINKYILYIYFIHIHVLYIDVHIFYTYRVYTYILEEVSSRCNG